MGSDITLLNAWTDRRQGYGAPVPRIFSCGAMIEATRTFFHGGSFFADTDPEARALVRKEKRDGAVAINSYFTLPWPLHRASPTKRGATTSRWLHRHDLREIVIPECWAMPGRAPAHPDPGLRRRVAVARQDRNPVVSTIGVPGGNALLFAKEPHLLSCGCVRAFTSQTDSALAQDVEVFSDLSPAAILESYQGTQDSLRQAQHLGVTMLAGTDAQNPNTFYGHGLHMEFRHLAAAGVPPLDILRLANTADAETTVGAEDVLGTLVPGKLANLVLLDENPLDDIRHTLAIWRIVQGGNVFASRPEVEATV